MTDTGENEKSAKKTLGLSRPGRLELKKTVETGQVRQTFPHGRSKTVTVEVKRKRTYAQDAGGRLTEVKEQQPTMAEAVRADARSQAGARTLTEEEKAARVRALKTAAVSDESASRRSVQDEAVRRLHEERIAAAELEAKRREEEEEARRKAEEEERRRQEEEARRKAEEARHKEDEKARRSGEAQAAKLVARTAKPAEAEAPVERPKKPAREEVRRPRAPGRREEPRRRQGKLTITQALEAEDNEARTRSLASVRRARQKQKAQQAPSEPVRKSRLVVVPEWITVQELANRMAERAANVIKTLMNMGVMATINQTIDGDTAELVVAEFGHKVKRVSESDVEIGIEGEPDPPESLRPRPPVVTVMGHVDHGKTSLLDALRKTDVVSREAGGITQHIGAYQVELEDGGRITFLDTPGHEAFTAMRARGAKVTDIVVLVVAADDGVQPQTVEAINHAKAADVPIIVAINKIDRPEADPARIRNELLQHEIVSEEMGGDVQMVEVSAKEGTNLDKLEEAILLQAELLELAANPDREAQGVVVEAKLDRGRGPVATLLIMRGTLHVGDILIAGGEWGRVRALYDDRGNQIKEAGPSAPVEVLGLNGTPMAGDDFSVVENEARAREIAEFRQRKLRQAASTPEARGTIEQMFTKIAAGKLAELPVVVKADVQGSVEAIVGALQKLATDEVSIRVLHAGVGGINESDVVLAASSRGMIIAFNVRAHPQARRLAQQHDLDIRYYSVIYDIVDDMKKLLSGLLAPEQREQFLGRAEVREVFNVSKVGRVAGCMITEGVVRRGARVRLLRDEVVVHEGKLATLKRFKDDVREVKEGYECGMSFENYQDIQVGDVIECYEVEEVAREL